MHSKRQFISAKLISVFLSVIILVFSIPLGVADGYEPLAADPISGNRSKPDVIEWEESRPVLEMMDKRGEFEKHYVTSDGKLISVTYAESIHYLDECGDYRDIDASLLLDGQVYRAQIGDYRVNLPEILSADSNLTIQNGKESLQWALSAETIDGEILQCAESEAELVECKDDYDNLDDPNGPAFALPNVTSSTLYSKAFAGQDNLDVRYTVSYNRIEEDVIFRGRSNVSAFSITVLSEHSPAVNENGSIDFLNTDGRIEFSVGSPYLMDAKGEVSNSVSVTAEKIEDEYRIRYALDWDWLQDENRAYPVVFDPSISTKEYQSNIVDTYVYEGSTDDHSTESRIYVGVKSNKIHRSFIKINNLPVIAPGATLSSANLAFHIYTTATTGKTVGIYRPSSSWNPSTVTYANQPSTSGSVIATSAFDASTLIHNLSLTSDLQTYYQGGSYQNIGYIVKYMDESKTDPDWNSFYSTDYTSHTSYRPLLTVTYSYSLPTGLSNGGIYSFQNVGSNSIMNVHNGTNANDTNVYQVNTSPSSATNAQKFKLDYVSSMDCYYLRAMCSSSGTNRVLDIVKSDGFVEDGGNVQIYKPVDDLAQYWLIIHLGGGEFLLLPRTNANLALTAYGNSNGTSGGQTSTSAGNIFVSYYNGSDYQKWKIYDHSSSGYVIPNNGSVLSLNYSTISVNEGETKTITAITNPSGLAVSWSTDSPSVATVNSQGVVTGVTANASFVNITASVTIQDAPPVTKTCKVYVTMADGVYYFKNTNSNLYLHAENGSIANGTDAIQCSKYAASASDAEKIRQMWKVKYLGDGKYSIRPMHKLNMGLYVSSGNAVIQSIGTSDSVSGVPSSAQWTIERYSGPTSNLVVKKGGVSNQTLQIQNGSTSINCPAVVSNYSTSANCRWALEKISNPPCGVILYSTLSNIYLNNPTKYVSPNEIITLQALNLVAAAYADNTINQTVTWHSVGSGIASVGYSTGAVTGIVPGTETVFAKKYLKGANRTATYSLNVTELENGIYFIKNKGTSRYVDIEGPTMAAGTTIHQWDFHGGDSQRWIFTHLGNGYYSIKSANSTENYYLGVENDSSAADAPIVLRTGTLTNGMKWRIEVAASGALKILPESGEQYNRVLAVGSYILNFNVNGIDIEQRNYNADTDYIDEWFVTTEINFGFSTDNYTDGCLHGERQSYRYANKFFNKITNQVSQSIFGKVHHYNMDSNRTASKNDYSLNGAFSNNIDFMIYIGHGLTAIDNKGNRLHYNCDFNGNYHTNDHNDEDYNAYSSNMHFGSSESKLRWVWLYTCNFLTTGDHVDDADLKNMMTGAHIVMGYASTAYLCDNMVEAFAFHLRNGEPIISAFFRAGYEGEASATSDHHLQKVLYIPQAINETIYSPCIHYSYNSSDVLTDMHDIQVPYD